MKPTHLMSTKELDVFISEQFSTMPKKKLAESEEYLYRTKRNSLAKTLLNIKKRAKSKKPLPGSAN